MTPQILRPNKEGSMRVVFTVLAFILFAGVWTATEAQSAQRVAVKINHESAVRRTGLKIKFIDLVEDSRCPKDVECVWAGNAKIKVRVSKNGRSKVIELNSNSKTADNTFAGYELTLTKLTPERHSNVKINGKEYVAEIKVERSKE
jgi:hypothetical protein